jgi:serine phosphatase RsbU (regulator of sigma subunit)
VGLASAWSLTRLEDVRSAGREVIEQAQPAETAASALSRATLEVQIETAIYILQPSPSQARQVTAAKEEANRQLTLLQSLTLDDQLTRDAVDQADAAYRAWVKDVIDPVVRATAAGNTAGARAISTSKQSQARSTALDVALAELTKAVDDWRLRSISTTSAAITALERSLVLSLLALLLAVIALWWGLRQWVTTPLNGLSRDLQAVSEGDLEHPIGVTGPPDIAQTMRDAEDMRQRLLREVDDAVAAREALDHRGPVVAALRRELRASGHADVPHLDAAGLLIPAEGVLAGDWFDLVELPDGRLGMVCVDVAGHGPLAGLAALRLKYVMTSALRSGSGVRAAIEAAALAMDEEDERFATGVAVTVSSYGEIAWCSAGHPTPLVVARDGLVDRLAPTGPLVSGLGGTWTVGRGSLPVGGTLVVMSDGILESRGTDGRELSEVWGDADVAGIVNDAPDARAATEQLAAAARARAAKWRVDDVTVVAIRRT